MSVLDNFDQWKSFLGERLEQAGEKGLMVVPYQIWHFMLVII